MNLLSSDTLKIPKKESDVRSLSCAWNNVLVSVLLLHAPTGTVFDQPDNFPFTV
jgi:hypothetical protein